MMGRLDDPALCRLIIAVMVKRWGDASGIVSISQAEIDAVTYGTLLDGFDENGSLLLKVKEQELSG